MTLSLSEFAKAKGFTVDELSGFGLRDAGGSVEIPYHNPDGTEYSRIRIRSSVVAKDGSRWSPGTEPMIPYGLHQPVSIDSKTKFAFIVEGETDALSLWCAGMPAFGIPGASNASCLRAEQLTGVETVYVVKEPGEAGERFPHRVAMALFDSGFAGIVHAIIMPAPFKDPAEAFQSARAAFKDVMRAAVKASTIITRKAPVVLPAASGVMTFDDLARRSSEHVDWAIEGIVRRSGILLMASRPKVGKSDTARNLAKAIATGSEFLGRRCQRGKVLWIGLEEPMQHLTDRLDVMDMKSLDIDYVIERQPGDESAWLRSVVEQHKPDVVFIDTIGRFSKIENVNDYSQVARATQPILDLRSQHGTTFVLLHHNNNSNTTLGSTMWEGFCDSIMSLTRNADGTRFVQTKQRSGIDMEPTALTMNHDTGLITCKESAFIADQRTAERNVLNYLRTTDSATKEDLANKSGRSASIGRSAVDSLLAAKFIEAKGAGTRGDPRLYCAINRPEESLNTSEKKYPLIIDEESYVPRKPSRGLSEESPRLIEETRTFPKFPGESEESELPRGNEDTGSITGENLAICCPIP
jgi:hypothetical protein